MNAIVRTKRSGLYRHLGLGLVLAGSLACAVGCKTPMNTPDPLINGPTRPAGKSVGSAGSIPGIPESTGTTSTAALAPGAAGSDLRIGGGAPAVLGKPEPIRDTVTSATATPLPVPVPSSPITLTGGPTPRIQTVEQGLAWLEARGARGARLDFVPEAKEWRFVCSVPNRDNPKLRRTHETQARDPLSAVQAVIEQIEREQK